MDHLSLQYCWHSTDIQIEETNINDLIALIIMVPGIVPLSQNLGISILQAMNKHRFRSLAYLVLEFAVPLLLKNGQTIGKKCFSIGIARIDGVKLTPVQLFVRTVLGKFAVETMIPVYVVLMLFWGIMGIGGTLVLLILLVIQIVCIAAGQNRLTIHDRLAGTVAVDITSQKIFESTEDLIAYTKRIHAEQAKRQEKCG